MLLAAQLQRVSVLAHRITNKVVLIWRCVLTLTIDTDIDGRLLASASARIGNEWQRRATRVRRLES